MATEPKRLTPKEALWEMVIEGREIVVIYDNSTSNYLIADNPAYGEVKFQLRCETGWKNYGAIPGLDGSKALYFADDYDAWQAELKREAEDEEEKAEAIVCISDETFVTLKKTAQCWTCFVTSSTTTFCR